ncbi:MAG: precorrin-6y C5,15-methyltransferase (decarboxylating) subunit CbiE [Fretibacterium sp.]|nr:precorrin-6y C5,15-methyltransferase (decarboxylating) subunit CbiE [Fretibacterium sp.]
MERRLESTVSPQKGGAALRELIVAGVGPGAEEQTTSAVRAVIRVADCVVAAPRHLSLAEGHPNIITLGGFRTTFDKMEAQEGSVVVLVSGDPGLYSLLPLLMRHFPGVPLRVLPGVSSLQCLCAAVGETWQDAAVLSGHGRPLFAHRFLNTVERSRLTVLFCGEECSPRWACEKLSEAVGDLGRRVEAAVGERLSYPDQRVTCGTPKELMSRDYDPLSLLLVRNPEPWISPRHLRDVDFERGNVPMTHGEVRAAILERLDLTPGTVLWDVGAGTGSVAASAALDCPDSEVHAIECAPAALELIERNRTKFRLHNLTVHAGRVSSLIKELPVPTHVFIGGSGGELGDVLSSLADMKVPVRVLISAVTLGTLAKATALLSSDPWENLEAVQIAVSVSRPLGRNLLMAARNPVTLLCADSYPHSEEAGE